MAITGESVTTWNANEVDSALTDASVVGRVAEINFLRESGIYYAQRLFQVVGSEVVLGETTTSRAPIYAETITHTRLDTSKAERPLAHALGKVVRSEIFGTGEDSYEHATTTYYVRPVDSVLADSPAGIERLLGDASPGTRPINLFDFWNSSRIRQTVLQERRQELGEFIAGVHGIADGLGLELPLSHPERFLPD